MSRCNQPLGESEERPLTTTSAAFFYVVKGIHAH